MEQLKITSHQFIKKNHSTIINGREIYDIYECECCGLIGKRYGLNNKITVPRNKVSCTFYKQSLRKEQESKNKPQKVRVIHEYPCEAFGFEFGQTYDRVECPEAQKENFADGIWIYSEQRKEPVRLLSGEYLIVND